MTLAPLLVQLAERSGLERTALFVAWPAYTWMGGVFIFAALLVAFDALRGCAWLANRLGWADYPTVLSGAITCEMALLLALAASVYAVYEARHPLSDHITITTSKLPTGSKVRVVQISDVHIGLLFRESRLKGIVQAVAAARPDLLVSTGDLVDGRLSRKDVISHLSRLAAMLAAVKAPGGTFAVTGNHEYYAGLDQAMAFTRNAGFTLLRNQSQVLANGITVTGIDDEAYRRMGQPAPATTEADLLRAVPAGRFHLLLKHRPVVPSASDGHFDLQLSGHTHKGQLLPFYPLTWLVYSIHSGTRTMPKGSRIHVSRGSGTWGPPMRLCAPPEVTIIDIVGK